MRQAVGRCAWCGLVDHYLVEETCPACQAKVKRYAVAPQPAPEADYDGQPMGYEAADLRVLEAGNVCA